MTKLPRDHRTRLRGVVTRQRWKAPSKILKTVESSNCEGTLFHAPDKATHRCEQLGISRDRVLQRFDEWAEGATKLVRLNAFLKNRRGAYRARPGKSEKPYACQSYHDVTKSQIKNAIWAS